MKANPNKQHTASEDSPTFQDSESNLQARCKQENRNPNLL